MISSFSRNLSVDSQETCCASRLWWLKLAGCGFHSRFSHSVASGGGSGVKPLPNDRANCFAVVTSLMEISQKIKWKKKGKGTVRKWAV